MKSVVEKGKKRRSRTGSIKEYKKRKKEMLGDGEEVKKDIFKRTERSLPRAGDKEGMWFRCLRSGGDEERDEKRYERN